MTNEHNYPIKQFRLTDGSELVLEVMSESDSHVVARKVLCIESMIYEEGTRAFLMRPWMLYQDGLDQTVVINTRNVAAAATPTYAMLDQYYSTLASIIVMYHARETHGETTKDDLVALKRTLMETDDMYASMDMDANDSCVTDQVTNVVPLNPKLH